VNAGYQNASWGEFSAGSEGARWQFPIAGPVGIALLLNYDAGRDEEIKTLRGRNTRLKGMGKLGGALEAGAELSYQLDPFRAYVKGMQATRKRSYGGEELGHTAYVESGLTGQYPLSEQLTLIGNLSTTWANSGYQRGYFGVTSQQAQRLQRVSAGQRLQGRDAHRRTQLPMATERGLPGRRRRNAPAGRRGRQPHR
jgi:hypothetical protein